MRPFLTSHHKAITHIVFVAERKEWLTSVVDVTVDIVRINISHQTRLRFTQDFAAGLKGICSRLMKSDEDET